MKTDVTASYPILSILACFILLAHSASARQVRIWSFSELWDEANLIVIGTPKSTADTKDREYPNAKPTTWVGVDTVFNLERILSVTRNVSAENDSVTVEHDRYFEMNANFAESDGPSFVKFDPGSGQRYLIFLKRNANGVYEPLTGRYDPGGSFYLLEPFANRLDAATAEAQAKPDKQAPVKMPSHEEPGKFFEELKEAREFLAKLYAMSNREDVEKAIADRVKIGDTLVQHRGLLSEAMKIRLNPYSNRMVFTFEQEGRQHDPGGQGFWVLHIETDPGGKVVNVSVGIARK